MLKRKRSTRRPKTNRVERTRAGGEWTEAAFWSFIRSGLREMSRRWPPLVRHVFTASRRKYTGPNRRQKWEYECCECGAWKMQKDVQADHIEPRGRKPIDLGGSLPQLSVQYRRKIEEHDPPEESRED